MDPSSSGLSFVIDDSQLLDLSGELPESNDVDDLSLSDLSLDQTIRAKPFSLLSRPSPPKDSKPSDRLVDPEDQGGHGSGDDEAQRHEEEDEEAAKRKAARMREEKLQSDIFVLRKLNAAFSSFNEALDEAGSANQRVAAQLAETDALLNKYVGILSKSEEFAKLIFDEEWYGAEADDEQIERERIEEQERIAREARERELAAQREAERREREERERLEREEKERLEAEKRERAAARGGVRGVRGTRASMRGARTVAPPRPTSSTSTSSRARPSVAPGSGIPVKRGVSSGTVRGTTSSRGLSRRT
ncbi:hypothetical protein CC1G_06852 [Coprinopsis cinerea okayama7|uniref:DASH complex subunit DUO1 n=1 Tax=Coprinopsis cinerea (strain Okayama-7 / 130 / ATCC MYA-4618 / FGSC 9003) TaxID=240176 RepID=A8N6Y0_COPC7|nr:hypothetical protein CC1G_06852 [Coprinopsis cinerea okayama7\|eukprot:XP_001830586.2 hypothetical protein CC1G_06852 [Coprinopsis cinerea okayama7\